MGVSWSVLRGGGGGHPVLDGLDVEVAAFLEFQLGFSLLQLEDGEPMLIHELDDAFDFSEVHGGWPSRLSW
jgi:hypothetical protein